MRRTSIVLGVVAASAVFASVVNAGPPRDGVTGGGISPVGTHIGLAAHAGPNGANGHVVLKNTGATPGEMQGHVTCINVVGNRATIVFQVDKATGNVATVGQYRKLQIEDNGNPAGGQGVDRINGNQGTDAPQTCDTPIADGGVVQKGNLTVTDGG